MREATIHYRVRQVPERGRFAALATLAIILAAGRMHCRSQVSPAAGERYGAAAARLQGDSHAKPDSRR